MSDNQNLTQAVGADDYTSGFFRLEHDGLAWPKEKNTVKGSVVFGLQQEIARTDQSACDLLTDIFPTTTTNFIPEWNDTLGLPDKCLSSNPTIEEQRGQIGARLAATYSMSNQFYIDYAANLGFQIEVIEYGGIYPDVYDFGLDGQRMMNDEGYEYCVTFVSLNNSNIAILECEFSDILPAFAHCYFYYGGPNFSSEPS